MRTDRTFWHLPIALFSALALVLVACDAGDDEVAADSDGDGNGDTAGEECEDTDITVTQAVHSLAFTPIYVAEQEGFFDEEGLSVERIDTGGGGPDLQAMLAGDAQFNAGAGTYQIDAYREGQDVRTVYNFMDNNIVNIVISNEAAEAAGVDADSPIDEKIQALEGLTIGATRPGALTFHIARQTLREGGLDPDEDAEVVGAGAGPELIAALAQGQVDAIVQSEPVMLQAAAEGHGIHFINHAVGEVEGMVPFSMENIFTTGEYLESNPGCVQRFVNAIHAANQWIIDEDTDTVTETLAVDFPEVDQEVLSQAVEFIQEASNPTGELDPAAVEVTLTTVEEEEITVDDIMGQYTDQFLPEG